jgi:cytochrome c-type biogenesis protein CcmE
VKVSPKAVIAAGLLSLAAVGAYLLMAGNTAGSLHYYKAAEFARLDKFPATCQVHGTVAPGSVQRLPVGVRFTLMDGDARIPVEYLDIVPDAFAESRELVVEGGGSAAGFKADRLLVKCPSKYNPASEAKPASASPPNPAPTHA